MPGTNLLSSYALGSGTEHSSWSCVAGFAEHLKRGQAFPLPKNRILVFDATGKSASSIFDANHQTTIDTQRFNFSFRYNGASRCLVKQGQDQYLCSIGGTLSDGNVTHATQAFDLTASKWHPIANLRRARHGAACVQHKDHVYVFGGIGKRGSLNRTAEILRWGKARWKEEVQMATPRTNGAAVTVGDQIYLLGGDVLVSQSERETTNSVEQFDVAAHDWKESPAMRVARRDFLAVAVGDRVIVVIGGVGKDGRPVKEVEMFDTERQEWGLLGIFSDPYPGLTACVVGPNLYVYCNEKLELRKMLINLDSLDKQATDEHLDGSPCLVSETSVAPLAGIKGGKAPLSSSDVATKLFRATLSNPTRPRVQVAQDVPGRILALEKWVSSMQSMKDAHAAATDDTIQHITEAFNTQRDLEVCALRHKAQPWLDETDRLLDAAKQQITRSRKLLEQDNCDRNRLAEIGGNQDDDPPTTLLPPRELCCPITLTIMHDPVLASDGNTYERRALEKWFMRQSSGKNPTSPMTGCEMETRAFFPNLAIRSLCRHFHSKGIEAEA